MRARLPVLLALLALAAPALAQKPAAPAPAPSPEATPAAKEGLRESVLKETEAQPGQFQYLPQGRRDPFVSLLVNVGPTEGTKGPRGQGLQGFLIQEVALKGIVKDQSGFIALLQGPDGKSYFPRVGQRLYDGVITAMDQTSVTFRQEVADPLSPVKTRDVKKSLYPSEEARQ